jgi:hypothetical protein
VVVGAAPEWLVGVHINLLFARPAEISRALALGEPAPAALSGAEKAAYDELHARGPVGYLIEQGTRTGGTGKTLLARAVAGEAGVPFLASRAASSAVRTVEMWLKTLPPAVKCSRVQRPSLRRGSAPEEELVGLPGKVFDEHPRRALEYGANYGYVTTFSLDTAGRLEFICVEAWLASLGTPAERRARSREVLEALHQ